jgi:hypothetical protein
VSSAPTGEGSNGDPQDSHDSQYHKNFTCFAKIHFITSVALIFVKNDFL